MPISSGFHSRGYLPHLKVEGATYFVTFRLADSLPKEVVVRLKSQRAGMLRRSAHLGPEVSYQQQRPFFEWYASEIDTLLDRSIGETWLNRPSIAAIVAATLNHFAAARYKLAAWVVMPNHVHAVVQPLHSHTLEKILHSWKSYSAESGQRSTASYWKAVLAKRVL